MRWRLQKTLIKDFSLRVALCVRVQTTLNHCRFVKLAAVAAGVKIGHLQATSFFFFFGGGGGGAGGGTLKKIFIS